ncbi:FAD-dependent oxidoreductase [Halomontanus rarus]|uniref:FAD-dependent oxidoreductase n=1 Tax=Halomontanus rarus TaxID=3034020 RepID=UPI001A997F1D
MDSMYEVVVTGGTPAGVAAAVHAARADLETCLVTYNDSLGGMMASGLSMTDTLLHPRKGRSPVLDEFFERVRTHYRTTYGPDSDQYRTCNGGLVFEPHVAEETFEALVDAESSLTVERGWRPVSADRAGRSLRSVSFESFGGDGSRSGDGDADETRTLEADAFVDATYEGDLAAVAGAPYRVGRESREEYGERFAGRVFTDADDVSTIRAGSTGEGDDAVQSYNYRLCLSSDPENRRYPDEPDGYDRREYLWVLEDLEGMREYVDDRGVDDPMTVGLADRESPELAEAMDRWYETGGRRARVDDEDRWVPLAEDVYRGTDPAEDGLLPLPAQTRLLDRSPEGLAGDVHLEQEGDEFVWGNLPNDKRDMNACDLVGESHAYPEADWDERREIANRHREYVLGFLYFLQNDDAVPEAAREQARQWGLAKDEFVDDDNFPFQLYVREARRIEGRKTFTEGDAFLAPGLERAPVHGDAVGIAEFPLDPHDVRAVRRQGTAADGRFFLTESTVPSQIPYGSLVPTGLDDLLVPVALSASHVGFQTIRLEPTWFQLGEAAGVAAARAVRTGIAPGTLDSDGLLWELAERGSTLSYFADVDVSDDGPHVAPIQFLGTKGFFDSYEARPSEPLDATTAEAWARTTADLLAGDLDAAERARALPEPERRSDAADVDAGTFLSALEEAVERDGVRTNPRGIAADLELAESTPLTRGEACRIAYGLVTDQFGR